MGSVGLALTYVVGSGFRLACLVLGVLLGTFGFAGCWRVDIIYRRCGFRGVVLGVVTVEVALPCMLACWLGVGVICLYLGVLFGVFGLLSFEVGVACDGAPGFGWWAVGCVGGFVDERLGLLVLICLHGCFIWVVLLGVLHWFRAGVSCVLWFFGGFALVVGLVGVVEFWL